MVPILYNSMFLSYEITFYSDFQSVQGDKLLDLRGGPDDNGYPGDAQPIGDNYFMQAEIMAQAKIGILQVTRNCFLFPSSDSSWAMSQTFHTYFGNSNFPAACHCRTGAQLGLRFAWL